ncbi:hypothetical protein [Sphaerimonospora thailandensis]|uniref:Uncharacterized protein n=1 Tax=Sphaerimonospora thailandensis TaxID=795644 RepID=A0A8J3VXW6_9ACTN|nr:hypothetical protein [Sphaerimonospora thailandensis]GIH69334.1 hypothetical protein Mth01_15870 [Sphaerimonospora thailandensis]
MPPEHDRRARPGDRRRDLTPRPSAGRAHARPWPGTRRRAAAERAARQRAELARGVRFRSVYLAIMGVVLAVAAMNVLLGSVGVINERRSRPLTEDERARYVAQDVARRWHAWPIGMVFPEELPYTALGRARQDARRVGVAPEAPCTAALDSQVTSVLGRYGCRTVLRATYVDQTATFVVTVGIAVLRDEEAGRRAAAELPVDDRVGVRPAAFPGTITDTFGPAQRQWTGWVGAGPYIVFATAGYADGRTRESVPPEELPNSEMVPVAQSIAGRVARALVEPPDVPRCTRGDSC